METFERTQFFARSVEDVWSFFSDVDNLNRFTPDFFRIQILTEDLPDLHAGQEISYRFSLYGVPFRWVTIIDEVDKPRSFVDSQLRGPYSHFRHSHQFWRVEGGTLMVDRVTYDVGWGPLGWVAKRFFVRPVLEAIFAHRAAVASDWLASAD